MARYCFICLNDSDYGLYRINEYNFTAIKGSSALSLVVNGHSDIMVLRCYNDLINIIIDDMLLLCDDSELIISFKVSRFDGSFGIFCDICFNDDSDSVVCVEIGDDGLYFTSIDCDCKNLLFQDYSFDDLEAVVVGMFEEMYDESN